jgi:hypothetical protein
VQCGVERRKKRWGEDRGKGGVVRGKSDESGGRGGKRKDGWWEVEVVKWEQGVVVKRGFARKEEEVVGVRKGWLEGKGGWEEGVVTW